MEDDDLMEILRLARSALNEIDNRAKAVRAFQLGEGVAIEIKVPKDMHNKLVLRPIERKLGAIPGVTKVFLDLSP